MERTISWRIKHLIHNCVAHPLLPLADLCIGTYFDIIGFTIEKFHDITIPTEDRYNVQSFDEPILK